MLSLPWLKIGAVAALWTIIAGAAISGWMLGKSAAAREYSELQRRLTAGIATTRTCATDVELLDLPDRGGLPEPKRSDSGPTRISAPGYFHLRKLLTAR